MKIQDLCTFQGRVGRAYPREGRTVGTGLNAERQCVFSTGAFREPILAWNEGKHRVAGRTRLDGWAT
jgi:hypothetical protein